MQFPPSFLDEIRARLRPSEIIGRRVNLKSHSRGEHQGLCPFHNEKTPSFTVSDDKGFYHCFGCGAHGDIIKFVMETGGLSFVEAVTTLASEAGLQLPKQDPQAEERYKKMSTLYDVVETAGKWFEEQLHLEEGKQALEYLKKRGIDEKTIKTFRLGYAPDKRNALKQALLTKNCTEEQLISTGLVIKGEGDKKTYDRFRGRIIFPISDRKGRVIAFGGRILGEGQPKYLNSPETDIFHKGSVLYAMHLARQKAFDKGNIAIVEGYMDVIALYKSGITNVVAPLGTAVTENHLHILWKIAKEPVMCLDGDKAGKRAMYRVAENCFPILEPGQSLRFAAMPTGEDPDDVIKKYGIDSMRKMLANATPLSDVIWEMTASQKPLVTPEQKADFERRIMLLVEKIKNKTVKDYYHKHFKERLWEENRHNTVKTSRSGRKSSAANPAIQLAAHINVSSRERYEKLLVATVLNHPTILEDPEIEEEFTRIEIQNSELDTLRNAIIDELSASEYGSDTDNLHQSLEKNGFNNHISRLVKDSFLDNFAKRGSDINLAKSGWKYVLSCYNLDVMEEEYKKVLNEARDGSDERSEMLFELKKQKDVLKKLVETEKMSYEAALDD